MIAVGVIFLVLGVLDIWRGLAPLFASAPHWHMATDDVEVLAIGVAAIVGGIYVLRGANWARWLLAVWMALHVAISIGQPSALRRASGDLRLHRVPAVQVGRVAAFRDDAVSA